MSRFDLHDISKYVRERVIEEIDISRNVEDQEIKELIDHQLFLLCKDKYISTMERSRMSVEIFNSIRKLDIIQELVDDSSITEIMVNGTEGIFIEQKGCISRWKNRFISQEKLEDVIQRIVAGSNRMVNESSPIVDSRLENGSRVHVVLPPIALNGPILTIRRFPDQPIKMDSLIQMGTLTEEAAAFLEKIVQSGYNILISGGTGSGKTTFLNALSEYIPETERIITIEDSAELQIRGIQNLVRMEVRNANVEGCREINIRELIRASLRMRPDRIIVGEVRGGEAIDMIQAMSTGHDGSMSTGHANSARDMLLRLETMILMGMDLPTEAIRRQISSGIDIIVHLGRIRDRSRKVLEIAEVGKSQKGCVELKTLFLFREEGEKDGKVLGTLQKKEELSDREKIYSHGLRY